MASPDDDTGAQDWRLQADLGPEHASRLDALLGRLGRSGEIAKEAQASAPADVVITHDGRMLFAYAADEGTLRSARSAIEDVLAAEGVQASVRVSRWDDRLGSWRQVDPPPSAAEEQALAAAERDAETPDTRTLVAQVGREIRGEFVQSLKDYADRLGVGCEIVEHPHLLSTQVAFTVSGPKRRLDEFAQALRAEERATIRTETGVMVSPL